MTFTQGSRFRFRTAWMQVVQCGHPLETELDKAEFIRKLSHVPADAIYWCRADHDTDILSRPHPFVRVGNRWFSLMSTPYGKTGPAESEVYRTTKTLVWQRPMDGKKQPMDNRLTYILGRLARQHHLLSLEVSQTEPTATETPFHTITHDPNYQLADLPARLEEAVQKAYPESDHATYLRGALDLFRCFFDLKATGMMPMESQASESRPMVKDVELNPLLTRMYPKLKRYSPY